MKKYFAIIIVALCTVFQTNAQTRGVKIGYIDMEYILQNVPDYSEAKSQLEQKAQKWKTGKPENRIMMKIMDEHLSNHPAEGVLSMVGLMAEHGFHVNPKRIRRLFKIMDYCANYRRKTSLNMA